MQHHRYATRLTRAFAGLTLAAVAFVAAGRAGAQSPPTPPPSAPPGAPSAVPTLLLPLASPSPSPAPRGRHGRRGNPSPEATGSAAPAAAPTSTPTSPAFASLDGTWEVQLQYIDHTDYSYLVVKQSDTGLSGLWRVNGKEYPFTGTYDGRLFSLVVQQPKGNVTMTGYVESASDMVGTVDLGDGKADKTPFTAEHRAGGKGSFFKDSAPDRPHTPGHY